MNKIKWLLFHEPAELFIRTAKHFEQLVNERCDNSWEFEILELKDYESLYTNGVPCDPVKELREGRIHMSQLYSQLFPMYNALDFCVFDIPFLFKDHGHAARVFEGQIGKQMLDHLQEHVSVKGLSFTYSGGYMGWKCDTPITNLDEIKELSIHPRQHPVSQDCWNQIGINICDTPKEANVAETTLPRFHADGQPSQTQYIETGHCMYLTTIFMNEHLWDSLDTKTQTYFTESAKICAQTERAQSVQEAEDIKASDDLKSQRGIQNIYKLSDDEQQRLVDLFEPVKMRWKNILSPGLVDSIIDA